MHLELFRSREVTTRMLLNLAVVFTASIYFLYSYHSSGWTYDIVAGVIFFVWSVFILWHAFKRKLLFKTAQNGFTARAIFGSRTLEWDQLVAMGKTSISQGSLLLVWKLSPDDEERFLVLSRKLLGEENIEKIVQIIKAKRPDLPAYREGEIVVEEND